MSYRLLQPDEPHPAIAERRKGRSSFVIAVDHAGHRIPARLNDLGLPPAELRKHVAWDIGALDVARKISATLDAPVVAQEYSRLVIDCNREPGTESSIPTMTEWSQVVGNVGLSSGEITARRKEIFEPYHLCLTTLLDERKTAGRPTILIALHTMTDVFNGLPREMHAAVLYHQDRRFARVVLKMLRRKAQLSVAENDPYKVHANHYTIPRHAERRGLPYVSIEIRQDLVTDEVGQVQWAKELSAALQDAEREFSALSDAE